MTDKNKIRFNYFIISVFAMAESLLISPKYQEFIGDKEVFRYMGMLICEGCVPYRDAFDHKPPVIYFLAALGNSLGPWGLWLATTLIVLASALLFFRACVKLQARLPVMYPLVFIVLMRFSPIIQGGELTREITASIVLCLFSINILQPGRLILMGVLAAVIFFTQQNELLAALPLFFLPLLWGDPFFKSPDRAWRTVCKKALLCLTGGALVCIPIVSFFFFHRALNDFWQQAFVFNSTVYVGSTHHLLKGIWGTARELKFFQLLYPPIILFCLCLAFSVRTKNKGLLRIVFTLTAASIAIQAFSISLSGNFYGHYFLGVIPYFCMLTLVAGLYMQKTAIFRNSQLIPLALFFLVCSRQMEFSKFLKLKDFATADKYHQSYPPFYFSELQKISGQRGQFYVFRSKDFLALNTDLRIIAPTKWIYDHLWGMLPTWDEDGSIFNGLIADLKKAGTQYILDFSPIFPLPRSSLQTVWDNFIKSRYDIVTAGFDDKGNRIWNFYELKANLISNRLKARYEPSIKPEA
jgi:hypothetical protein